MRRHLFFGVLVIAVAMYFLQTSLYLGMVKEARLAQCSGENKNIETVLRVEPLDVEKNRAICRVLDGENCGKVVMVHFGKLDVGSIDFSAVSQLDITVDLTARQFTRAKNFGFDYDKYLFSRGISAQYYTKKIRAADDGFSISKFRRNLRSAIADRIEYYELSGLLNALILGDKDDFDLYGDMKDLGISHLLVISGLHFSIIHSLFARLTNLFGNKCVRAVLVVLAMSFVLFVVKSSYSAERAFFSMLYYEAARLIDRRADILTAQSFAVGMILVRTPAAVLNTGFHLSLYTYFAIAFLYKRLTVKQSVPALEMMKFSLYVQVAGLPITCFLFGKVNVFSAFANMLVVPFFGLIVPLAFITVILVSAGIVRGIWTFFDGLLYSLIKIAPLKSINMSLMYFDVFIIFVFVVSLAFVFKKLYSRRFLIPLIVIACIIPAWHGGIEIVSFDVGHGDATLVRSGVLTCLVDTGDGRVDLASELRSLGITKLDMVVVTHFHDDHYGGLEKLLSEMEVEYVYVTETMRDYLLSLESEGRVVLEDKRVNVVDSEQRLIAKKGSDSVGLEFFRLRSQKDENDNGICVAIDVGGKKCWFFGDASSKSILSVVANSERRGRLSLEGDCSQSADYRSVFYQDAGCVFMKAAHHGSKTSSSVAVFDAVAAEKISVSHSKKYNMPSKDFISAVSERSVHSTYYSGCAIFRIPENKVEIRTYLDG